jgi:hypothetical protein
MYRSDLEATVICRHFQFSPQFELLNNKAFERKKTEHKKERLNEIAQSVLKLRETQSISVELR